MPDDLKATVNTNVDCIDAFFSGLQGPDFLYYHMIGKTASAKAEARKIHHSPGGDFFEHAREVLKKHKDPESLSYIYGCMCHYILDSACHPDVVKFAKIPGSSHALVERELDSEIIRREGGDPRYLSAALVLPVNRRLGSVIAPFYKTATPAIVNGSFYEMRGMTYLLRSAFTPVRSVVDYVVENSEKLAGHRDSIVANAPIPFLAESTETLLSELDASVKDAVEQIYEFNSSIGTDKELSHRLDPDFLGKNHSEKSDKKSKKSHKDR